MANVLRIKRRAAGGLAGAPSSLRSGELAFNEENNTLYYGKGDSGGWATSIVAIAGTVVVSAMSIPNCGRFDIQSAGVCKFNPYNGDLVRIQGVLYQIPVNGVLGTYTDTVINGTPGQNLAANTQYLVCLYNNSGIPAIGFYTSLSHTKDTTAGNVGTEIAFGDPPRSVIGMVRTNASAQFQDDAAFRGVISWFNRVDKSLVGANTGGVGTTSSTAVEIAAAARVNFLHWGDDHVFAGVAGSFLSGAPGTASAQLGLNGTAVGPVAYQTIGNTTWWGPGSTFHAFIAAETMNYITVMGAGNGVTMNFHMACSGIIRG